MIPTRSEGKGFNYIHPPKVDFENPITAVLDYTKPGKLIGCFTFETKNKSVGKCPPSQNNVIRRQISPVDRVINKIQIWHNYCIQGFKFFDKNNRVILEIGSFDADMTGCQF